MRRFNNLLRESGLLQWSLKFIVVLVWVIWVVQVPGLLAKVHEYQSKSPRRELTREEQLQSFNFTSAKVTAARKLGNSYSPDHYYRDLRDIWRKYGPITDSNITVMQTYMRNNLQRFKGDVSGKYTAEDFERSRSKYEQELDKLSGMKRSKPLTVEQKRNLYLGFIHFYLLTALLSFPLFLLRMIEGKGVLATFLAGKLEFCLAPIFFWYYFSKYPDPVFMREVDVEAELRRLKGKYFGRLTKKERKQVKLIAGSDERYEEFKKERRNRLCLGYLVALMATIFFTFILPPSSSVQAASSKQSIAAIQALQRAGPTLELPISTDHAPEQAGILPDWSFKEPEEQSMPVLIQVFASQEGQQRPIDHIPLIGCLASFNRLIQTAGSKILPARFQRRNENEEYGTNRGCFGPFSDRPGCFCSQPCWHHCFPALVRPLL